MRHNYVSLQERSWRNIRLVTSEIISRDNPVYYKIHYENKKIYLF